MRSPLVGGDEVGRWRLCTTQYARWRGDNEYRAHNLVNLVGELFAVPGRILDLVVQARN